MNKYSDKLVNTKSVKKLMITEEQFEIKVKYTGRIEQNIQILNRLSEEPRPGARSVKTFRNHSPDAVHTSASLKKQKTVLVPKSRLFKAGERLPSLENTSNVLNKEITLLRQQIMMYETKNNELKNKTSRERVRELENDVNLYADKYRKIKNKVEKQEKIIEKMRSGENWGKDMDREFKQNFVSVKIKKNEDLENYEWRIREAKRKIEENSEEIKELATSLSQKQMACRVKLLKIKAKLRKKRLNYRTPSPNY